MESPFPYVGVRIISRLKELDLKQAELCKETGLSTTAMSAYCTGKRVPDTDSLYRIAKALKTSMEWILTGNTTNEDTTKEDMLCDGIPLSETEADLIAMYRLLDDRDEQTVFDLTRMKYEQTTGEKGSSYSTYIDTGPHKNGPKIGFDTSSETA